MVTLDVRRLTMFVDIELGLAEHVLFRVSCITLKIIYKDIDCRYICLHLFQVDMPDMSLARTRTSGEHRGRLVISPETTQLTLPLVVTTATGISSLSLGPCLCIDFSRYTEVELPE